MPPSAVPVRRKCSPCHALSRSSSSPGAGGGQSGLSEGGAGSVRCTLIGVSLRRKPSTPGSRSSTTIDGSPNRNASSSRGSARSRSASATVTRRRVPYMPIGAYSTKEDVCATLARSSASSTSCAVANSGKRLLAPTGWRCPVTRPLAAREVRSILPRTVRHSASPWQTPFATSSKVRSARPIRSSES